MQCGVAVPRAEHKLIPRLPAPAGHPTPTLPPPHHHHASSSLAHSPLDGGQAVRDRPVCPRLGPRTQRKAALVVVLSPSRRVPLGGNPAGRWVGGWVGGWVGREGGGRWGQVAAVGRGQRRAGSALQVLDRCARSFTAQLWESLGPDPRPSRHTHKHKPAHPTCRTRQRCAAAGWRGPWRRA